jgi:hypothetical protein
MLWTQPSATICALLLSTSLLAAQDVFTPHDGKKEEIYVIRSVRTSRITPTEYCALSQTGFADTVFEDRYVFHQAARIRGVSQEAIAHLIKKGRFRVLRIAGKVLLNRLEVEKYKTKPTGRPRKTKKRT